MKPFHFRKFSIQHHRSSMKVGTDSVLLGSWCNVDNPTAILDIGTGSGILALLMASRCDAIVDAIELDTGSVIEARENFTSSRFSNRMNIIQDDFRSFSENTNNKYELIISNPPFFKNGLLPESPSRMGARHTLNLNHSELLSGIAKVLSAMGKFCVVLPFDESDSFIDNALQHKLYPHRKLIIRPKKGITPNRINIEFRPLEPKGVDHEEIIIRNAENDYTDHYKETVEEYLLRV